MASLPMLERFKEEIGEEINYRHCGYLFVLSHESDVAVFQKNVEVQHRLGIQTEWLTLDDICKRLPLMRFEDALAGAFHAKDGLVDPNSVVMGYIRAATKLGVQAFNNVEVTGFGIRANRMQTVETSLGSVQTPLVLNAAGPWSAHIGHMAGLDIPIQPIRRQMFTTTPLPELPADFPFVVDFSQSLYFHREGRRIADWDEQSERAARPRPKCGQGF